MAHGGVSGGGVVVKGRVVAVSPQRLDTRRCTLAAGAADYWLLAVVCEQEAMEIGIDHA